MEKLNEEPPQAQGRLNSPPPGVLQQPARVDAVSLAHLLRQVRADPHFFDRVQLRFQEIGMLLFVVEQALEEFFAAVVTGFTANCRASLYSRMAFVSSVSPASSCCGRRGRWWG